MSRPRPSEVIDATAEAAAQSPTAPLVVLTARCWRDLRHERGTDETAARFLARLAARHGRPVGVNVGSQTAFIAPDGWTRQRLAGYVAARHAELEAAFGRAASVAPLAASAEP